MPLIKGKSPQAFSQNVKKEMQSGKPQKQALAIAYSMKRKAHKMAKGGMVKHVQSPGDVVHANRMHEMSHEGRTDIHSHGQLEDENKEMVKHDMHEHMPPKHIVNLASGGMVNDEEPSESVHHDDGFLADEDDSETPMHSDMAGQDEAELKEKYGKPYDELSMDDNQKSDAEEMQSRHNIMSDILRKVRMRNMGR